MQSSLLPLPWYTCPDILFLLESAYVAQDVNILAENCELTHLLHARLVESTTIDFRLNMDCFDNFETLSVWFRNPRIHDRMNFFYNWMYKQIKKNGDDLDLDIMYSKFGNWEHCIFEDMFNTYHYPENTPNFASN
jgi:hypothetical protein